MRNGILVMKGFDGKESVSGRIEGVVSFPDDFCFKAVSSGSEFLMSSDNWVGYGDVLVKNSLDNLRLSYDFLLSFIG